MKFSFISTRIQNKIFNAFKKFSYLLNVKDKGFTIDKDGSYVT